jgi:UTP--glucose-1-phosphate uridylyltransferase
MKKLRKVVIPVAGLGTRVLPATKSIPKVLLPVVDRPLIDYVIAEARDAGIDQFVLVTGRGKSAIEDYFDRAVELENALREKSKTVQLEAATSVVPEAGAMIYTRQQSPLGLGHAVWCARHAVGDEPFAVALPDEIAPSRPGFLKQLADAYRATGGNFVAVEEVSKEDASKYGVIAPKSRAGRLIEMSGMVEKPKPEEAPSNFRIVGRYLLQPEIFAILARIGKGSGGEIQLTDGMNALNRAQPFRAVLCEGAIYDCGSKLGWLQANLALGLASPELGGALKDYARSLLA